MPVCAYYLRGNCRFGPTCRNEHPPGLEGSEARGGTFGRGSGGGDSNSNNFRQTGNNESSGGKPLRDPSTLGFTADSMGRDFTQGGTGEKPIWPLSVYGPAKLEATYVTGIDQSPEEMRVRAYEARAQNQLNEYIAYENSQGQQANAIYSDRLQKIQDTFRHAVSRGTFSPAGPSDYQTTALALGTAPLNSAFGSSGFGTTSSTTAGGFGGFGTPKPAAFGSGVTSSSGSAFGASSFGAPAAPSFGQGSAFGAPGAPKPPTSAFGASATGTGFAGFGAKPAGFGTNSAPAFGQSGFGAPSTPAASAFGASTQPAPAFGQSAFGQAQPPQSAFGQNSFGHPSATIPAASQSTGFSSFTPVTASAFGQPSQPTSVFAPAAPAPAFGQPAQPTSAFGQQAQPASAFGKPSQSVSAFGQPPQSTSAFGQPSQPTSAFGQPSRSISAFGQPSQPTSAFGAPAPPVSAFGQTPAANQSTDNASRSGGLAPDPFAHLLPPNYLEVMPASIKEAFAREDEFEWGNIPEWIPPLEMR